VQMYGKLLSAREAQPDAFLVAAETLRAQPHLPRDLKASVGRIRASVLFQTAAKLFEGLAISLEGPWPADAFDSVLEATTRACEAYAEAVAESGDPQLCKEVEPHCPEWQEALAAVRAAHAEVMKLRAELRFREIRWHSRQAERAKLLSEAAAGRGRGESTAEASSALEAAGLSPMTAREEELLAQALAACESLVAECTGDAAADPAVLALALRGRALRILLLKDLAVACAMVHRLEESVGHMLRALRTLRSGDEAPAEPAADGSAFAELRQALGAAGEAQLRAAAQGVVELCRREITSADTQGAASSAARWAGDVSQAVANLDV